LTVSLADILPKRLPDPLAPDDLVAKPWEPAPNYNPATTPGSTNALKVLMPLETAYASSVPQLPPIPAVHHRHRRGSKGDSGKVDTFKLGVSYGLNPLAGGISKSAKCVLTADWRVAQAELRHIRAMERIEAKKAAGRWSLRQPKRHRGPPLPKGHWDWLLEEMVS
jgi:chromatin modification-related protein VID21